MLHAEVVTHLVSYRRRDDGNNLVVVHRDTAGELIGANWPLQSLPDHATIEDFSGQQLCIVVRVILYQIFLAIVEEAAQRLVAVGREIGEILFRPDDDTQQCDKYV